MAVCYATGLIGTPMHELSHALMCIIFGHKITEIRLYRISDDGVLGYVNHTYNPKNLYHLLGNYFIGVAPIFTGALCIYLLMMFLIPDRFSSFSSQVDAFINLGKEIKLIDVFNLSKEALLSIINQVSFSWQFIVFILVSLCFALHMNLSNADLKGAFKGLFFFLLILFIIDLIIYIIPGSLFNTYTTFLIKSGFYIFSIMIISLLFSLFLVLIALIIRIFINIFRRH